jgi:hypothetical protein
MNWHVTISTEYDEILIFIITTVANHTLSILLVH